MSANKAIRPATPPTTPPAIAPALSLLACLIGDGVGEEVGNVVECGVEDNEADGVGVGPEDELFVIERLGVAEMDGLADATERVDNMDCSDS